MSEFEVYRCTSNGHYKQWAVKVEGPGLVTRYGKIDGTQQQNTKVFPTRFEAENAKQKLIEAKLAKGYWRYGKEEIEPRVHELAPEKVKKPKEPTKPDYEGWGDWA